MAIISIITGVIAGDVAHKVAQDMNDTDEEIAQHIENGNIDKAIEESNRSMIGNIYVAVRDVIDERDDINVTEGEMAQFRQKIKKEADVTQIEEIIPNNK